MEIFERNGKRLTGLTSPGKDILRIIERLLLEAENLQQAWQEYSGVNSGTLAIATAHTQIFTKCTACRNCCYVHKLHESDMYSQYYSFGA